MSVLEISELSYRYKNSRENILLDVNQTFELGQFYAIIGSSGAGKSTLLSLLAGLDEPQEGNIYFENEDIKKKGCSYHRRNHISLVFQNYNLIDYLTPLENVRLVNKKASPSLLLELGLNQDQIKRNVMKLSGGQQQRICIARALAVQPEVLLMDEPTSALDPISTAKIEELMEDLKKKNGADMNDKEIVFSKSIKAGKRIYYLDVKKNRKDEMFLAITESKKVVTGEGEDLQVSFEKHKIFLYREDFEKFMNGLNEAIDFINRKEMLEVISDMNAEADENAEAELDAIAEMNTKGMELDGEIKIDIDFEEPTL